MHQLKIVAILTGHAAMRGHLYVMDLFEGDPSCRLCRKQTETVQRIICCCEVLAGQRYNVFGNPLVEPNDISTDSARDLWLYMYIHSFIHLAVSLTTGLKPLAKPALHIVRSRAPSFRCEYPLLSLRSPSSFLRLLPRLPVTSITPFTFPSITCHRRQFLRKIWPIQLAFRLLISCRIFLRSLTVSNTSFFTWSVQLIFSILLQHHISKLSRCSWSTGSTARSVQDSATYKDIHKM
jgi:hypothetical protein